MANRILMTVVISEAKMYRFGRDEFGISVDRKVASAAYLEWLLKQAEMNHCKPTVVSSDFKEARNEWHLKFERWTPEELELQAVSASKAIQVVKKKGGRPRKVKDASAKVNGEDGSDAI